MELLERDGALAVSPRRATRQRGARVAWCSSPASPGSARRRSSRGSCRISATGHACSSAPATTSRSRGRWARSSDLVGNVSPALEEALSAGGTSPELHSLLVAELGLPPQPTVLVLEDMHWADDATFDAITVLLRRIGSLPALVLLTCRDGEAPLGHPHPRRRRRGPPRRPRSSSSSHRCRRARSPCSPATTRSRRYAADRREPVLRQRAARLPHRRRPAAHRHDRRPRACVAARRRLAATHRARLGRAEPRRNLGAGRGDAGVGRRGGGARAQAAARGRAHVRALPARAGAKRDPVEHPDRRAAAPPRRDPRRAPGGGRRPGRDRAPRGGRGSGERRRRVRAHRGAARGGARIEPRGVLPLPARLELRRPPAGARAGDRVRGAGDGGVRGLPARGRLSGDRARDRGVDGARRPSRGRPVHADPVAPPLARGRRRRRADEGARRRSRSSSRSASPSSWPVPTAACPSSRIWRRTTSARSSGASGRSSSRTGSATTARARTCSSTSPA